MKNDEFCLKKPITNPGQFKLVFTCSKLFCVLKQIWQVHVNYTRNYVSVLSWHRTYLSGWIADSTNIRRIMSKLSNGKGKLLPWVISQTKPWHRPFLYSACSWKKMSYVHQHEKSQKRAFGTKDSLPLEYHNAQYYYLRAVCRVRLISQFINNDPGVNKFNLSFLKLTFFSRNNEEDMKLVKACFVCLKCSFVKSSNFSRARAMFVILYYKNFCM